MAYENRLEKLRRQWADGQASLNSLIEYHKTHSKAPKVHNNIDELPLQETSWAYVTLALGRGDISIDQYEALRQALINSYSADG